MASHSTLGTPMSEACAFAGHLDIAERTDAPPAQIKERRLNRMTSVPCQIHYGKL
jgi:hypothetical protein